MPEERPAEPSWARRTLRSFLELLGACGLAVAEPVLASFREGAEVFVARRAGAFDVVVFTLIVLLLPALVLLGVELLFSILGRAAQRLVHAVLLGGLAGLVVAGLLKDATSWNAGLLVAVAIAAAIAALAVFLLLPAARLWLRYLALFPLGLGLAFLFLSPVTDIVFGGGEAAADASEIGNPAPTMVIFLDELPLASLLDADNQIDPDQFPNLAALAGDATWFRNNTSVAPSTPQAVPPLLTGVYPDDPDALPLYDEFPNNLFTLLGSTYEANVFEGVTRLCPDDVCPEGQGLREGGTLDGLLDDAVDVWQRHASLDRDAEQVDFQIRQSNPDAPATIQDFIDSLEASGPDPRLDFLHVLYPHQPWQHAPSGLGYDAPFVAKGLTQTYSWDGQQVADAGRQRHLLQLQHADTMVGAIVNRMRHLGTYDESLIVLTADHGVAFSDGSPIRGLSTDNAPEVMWTPLFVKRPGQTEARVDDRPTMAVDVLPTIADVLEVDVPWDVDGRSAFGEARPDDTVRRFFEWRLNALQPSDGHYVEVDGETGFERLLAARPPGRGADPELRFYRFGEWGRLVGLDVESRDLPVDIPDRPLTGELERAAEYSAVDRSSGTIPIYVSGTVDSDQGDVGPVAVAVNGRIAGWSDTHFSAAGEDEWWTIVPEWWLLDQANEITLFAIEGTPARPRLTPIDLRR